MRKVDELAGVAVTLQPDIILYQKVGAIVKFRTLIYQWMDMKCSQTYGLIGKTLPKAGEVAS